MKFKVKIIETRYKVVDVAALTAEEAKDIVANWYRTKQVELLDGVDMGDVEFVAEVCSERI